MRKHFHCALLNAIETAAANGDPVAVWVNEQIHKEDENDIFPKKCAKDNFRLVNPSEYFDGTLQIACDTLDPNQKIVAQMLQDDPDLRYKQGHFDTISPTTFVKLFKHYTKLHMTDQMAEDFKESLRVGSKLTARLSDDYYDFEYAYLGSNYAPWPENQNNTLHKSCMQDAEKNQFIAEFYKYVCDCKIIVVTDASCRVVGRALVWPNATVETPDGIVCTGISVVSRLYYTCLGVKAFMLREIENMGIDVRAIHRPNYDYAIKVYSADADYYDVSCRFWTKLNLSPLYHGKVPYVDFFDSLWLKDNELYLSDARWHAEGKYEDRTYLSTLDSTYGEMAVSKEICPICGKASEFSGIFCPECFGILHYDIVAHYPVMEVTDVKGFGPEPAFLVEDGELKSSARASLLYHRMRNVHKEG